MFIKILAGFTSRGVLGRHDSTGEKGFHFRQAGVTFNSTINITGVCLTS